MQTGQSVSDKVYKYVYNVADSHMEHVLNVHYERGYVLHTGIFNEGQNMWRLILEKENS